MLGLMMDRPLQIIDLLKFAADTHGERPIVSATVEGPIHRTDYAATMTRVSRLAHALRGLGIVTGDRVATLAWNGYRHLELYYAVSGMGAVCHTINPRLSADQMSFIINHAEDSLLFTDLTFVPMIEALRDRLPAGLRVVAMTDRAHMPDSELDLLCYEDLLHDAPDSYDWPELPENTASGLCYTSGTTGRPKGALYTHRSSVLHALMTGVSFQRCLNPASSVLPVVPLFHVNAWGLPYSAPLTGTAIVFPGPALDGASVYDLLERERVFSAWGVPTVWQGLQAEIGKRGRPPQGFGHLVVGGSAATRSMIAGFEGMGVEVCHAWGMTEMSPIGTQGGLDGALNDQPEEERIEMKSRQGRRIFGVELKITDEAGHPLPHDGRASGELHVRGPAVISAYYNNPDASRDAFDADGWFATGDVARIDPQGFLTITDRAKDLIKSGGEWISSLELENIVIAHPDVASCAVIAVPHPKWDERPLLIVVPAEGRRPQAADLLKALSAQVARWQLPDDVVFVDTLPLTATGKVSKLTLREQFRDHVLPPDGGS
ncbi:long-chain-fatty-acid--CoA ligase [Brevirhabdus sp.]|uniref:long-chain-fatty-acid--CoA ligase n=1 Tax=Brevirhabdus sp. TaxID=2004514 RepID=UPI004057DD21